MANNIPKTKRPTSASAWKSSKGKPIEVPSGNTCLVRMVGMPILLKQGIIPNSLRSIIESALSSGNKSFDMASIKTNQIEDMANLFDAVTCYCVIEPKVNPVPEKEEDRNDDLLYVDDVDFEDKMFIFQFVVGGTRDVEKFRAEQTANLESVLRSQDLELPSQ